MYYEKMVAGKDFIGIKLNPIRYNFKHWFNENMEANYTNNRAMLMLGRHIKKQLHSILVFLKSVHESGQIFNNLKPNRIFFDDDKKIKFADFMNMEDLGN